MEKAVSDYILTCTFAALIGELIGVGPGPGDISLLFLLPCVFGYFSFLLSFARDYTLWLEEPAEPQVPLGMIPDGAR